MRDGGGGARRSDGGCGARRGGDGERDDRDRPRGRRSPGHASRWQRGGAAVRARGRVLGSRVLPGRQLGDVHRLAEWSTAALDQDGEPDAQRRRPPGGRRGRGRGGVEPGLEADRLRQVRRRVARDRPRRDPHGQPRRHGRRSRDHRELPVRLPRVRDRAVLEPGHEPDHVPVRRRTDGDVDQPGRQRPPAARHPPYGLDRQPRLLRLLRPLAGRHEARRHVRGGDRNLGLARRRSGQRHDRRVLPGRQRLLPGGVADVGPGRHEDPLRRRRGGPVAALDRELEWRRRDVDRPRGGLPPRLAAVRHGGDDDV